MNLEKSILLKKLRKAVLLSLACLLTSGLMASLSAAGARKLLKLDLSTDRRTAVVIIPPGYPSVTIQRFDPKSGWEKFITKKVSAGKVKFSLPSSRENVRWRAMGRFESKSVSHDKFPAKFYAGQNHFGPRKSNGANGSMLNYFRAMNNMGAPGAASGDTGGEVNIVPEEADIWKVDGNTVYFFNQLRGLQVLDVSNPADPRITASLRLPAEGEDLYLLPGSGGARFLVLLTKSINSDYTEATRINLVKVANGKAEIVQTSSVQGYLSDSRMAGNQLITATIDWFNGPATDSGYTTVSRLNQCSVTSSGIQGFAKERLIQGENPLISSGTNWLAVSVNPLDDWNAADVSVFGFSQGDLVLLNKAPIRTAGYIADKFKIQWSGNVLTTISETYKNGTDWTPTTILENFRVWGPNAVHPVSQGDGDSRLGQLQLADGESLFATRFAGDKAYVVTFKQTDPLWIVDLSDPANPVVSGQIEVSGWSTHLEPVGDFLLAIGWDSNTVAASLFDVADPSAPKLLSHLNLGAPGSYSVAAWDDQALKVIPDAGLAMIPLTSFDETKGGTTSVVQLLDIDFNGRKLTKLGTITHGFDARRADLVGNTVVSISQRELITADISNPKAPVVLADVSLAWPSDRVVNAGAFVIQIENGGYYGGNRATARISKINSTEEILSETDLGDGVVRAAEFRDGKLFVLREISTSQPWYRLSPFYGRASGTLSLDVYSGYSLPELTRLGSCSKECKDGMQIANERLLWPRPNRPAVVLASYPSFWYWWGGPIMLMDGGVNTVSSVGSISGAVTGIKRASLVAIDLNPNWYPWSGQQAPRVLVFDTSDPTAPVAGSAVEVGTSGTSFSGVCEAADGLVVMGTTDTKNETNGEVIAEGKIMETARVVEISETDAPTVRPAIDLPGWLFAICELDSKGFLAYTRHDYGDNLTAFETSACDGFEAFEIAGFDEDAGAAVAAGGRRVFVTKPDGVARHRLSDQGLFVDEEKLEIGWQPDQLRVLGNTLLGSRWNSLFAAHVAGDVAQEWTFPAWSFNLSEVDETPGGGLLIPFGEYGAEYLAP